LLFLVILETIQTFWDVCFRIILKICQGWRFFSRLKGFLGRIKALLGTGVSTGYRSLRFF
jgi:hypothetical protein